jgi:hypothetical protein
MRFHARLELWFEVATLDEAGEAMLAAEQAAYAALGDAAIDDPASGALSSHFYEPIDDAARAAHDADDLGHGIAGSSFRHE